MSEWREIIEAPRWARFPKALRNLCFEMGLDLDMEVERGWLREMIRIRVSGAETELAKLQYAVYATIDEYQMRLQANA